MVGETRCIPRHRVCNRIDATVVSTVVWRRGASIDLPRVIFFDKPQSDPTVDLVTLQSARLAGSTCHLIGRHVMDSPSAELSDLLTQAAELRAAGASWAAVSLQLKHDVRTCRGWVADHPRLWRRLYQRAEQCVLAEARAEALVLLRGLSRSKDDKLSLAASAVLLRCRFESHKRTRRAGTRPDGGDLELAAFLRQLRDLSDADFTIMLEKELAGRDHVTGAAPSNAAPVPE
jgi:hypothetical protein